MCLSIPGKIKKISKNGIEVDYNTTRTTVMNSIVDNLKEGDWVLVENKFITRKLTNNQAEDFFKLINYEE